VDRAITDDPGVACEQVLVEFDNFTEVRRASFLFTFKNELDV
jgi:hypothetical protein